MPAVLGEDRKFHRPDKDQGSNGVLHGEVDQTWRDFPPAPAAWMA